MLTIKQLYGGETYVNHVTNNDYYAVGEQVTGRWIGKGAELLGLEGNVSLDDFEKIREGLDPKTGEFLRARKSANRYDEDGKKIGAVRNLIDFTVSAPKDLSFQALEDPRLVEVHTIAAGEMIQEVERLAGARVRKGGLNESRETGNLVISQWNHDSSRSLDPNQHTHFVAANLTYDGVEQTWKALESRWIYDQRDYLSEVYRNAAARELHKLGYQTKDRFEHGKDNGFGIVSISEETREKFSQRSAQRDAAIRRFVEKNGRLPNYFFRSEGLSVTLLPSAWRAVTSFEVAETKMAFASPSDRENKYGAKDSRQTGKTRRKPR